jgi:hypothetical protein
VQSIQKYLEKERMWKEAAKGRWWAAYEPVQALLN